MIGRGDKEGADQAAVDAMRHVLDTPDRLPAAYALLRPAITYASDVLTYITWALGT